MNWSRFVLAATLAGLSTLPVQAQVSQGTAQCLMSIVGPDGIHLSMPAQVYEPGFAVQMKDQQGNPLSGIEVSFFVNHPIQLGLVPPGTPPLPPQETYGRLSSDNIIALTDQQGIARSGPFTGGTLSGAYDVAALVWVSGNTVNSAACVTVPGPLGYFRVTQRIGASAGTISNIPTLTGLAPWLLGLIVLGMGVLSARRAQHG